uniref:(California timema) hypothetical protein n=1 Tax=Timema californicum TaxID=61474 RepID=A0A7R9JB79_TIMCA|nr:unnamed protein product [Timema californicum]
MAITEIPSSNTAYIPVKLEPHGFLNVCKGVVTFFDLDCVSIEEICEELSPKHVTEEAKAAARLPPEVSLVVMLLDLKGMLGIESYAPCTSRSKAITVCLLAVMLVQSTGSVSRKMKRPWYIRCHTNTDCAPRSCCSVKTDVTHIMAISISQALEQKFLLRRLVTIKCLNVGIELTRYYRGSTSENNQTIGSKEERGDRGERVSRRLSMDSGALSKDHRVEGERLSFQPRVSEDED